MELLTDFVADVGVLRVESCEGVGVSVDIRESEVRFSERLHYLEYVEGPSAFFNL